MFAQLRQWDNFLAASETSEVTRRSYRYHLLRFVADVLIDLDEVTEEDVTTYLAELRQRGKTVDQILRALKSYYTWAVRRGIHKQNPVNLIRFKKRRSQPVVRLTPDEFMRVFRAAERRHPKRAWAILLTLETGGRIGSIAGIKPDELPTRPGEMLHFAVAKGGRTYSVPVSSLAVKAIRELLPYSNGTLLGVHKNTLWSWYHQAAVDAGLSQRKQRAHVLRDTYGTNAYRKTRDPRLVQELLGHADLSQIHRYVAVDPDDMPEILKEPSFGLNGLDLDG